jgi:hypothetical protein
MKAKLTGRCLLIMLIGAAGVSVSLAQYTAGRFLLYNPSATSNGMGGIGTADGRTAFATYFNPAGLAYSPIFSLSGSFVQPFSFFGNVAHSYFAASFQLKRFGAVGASMNVFWKGKHPMNYGGTENLTDWQLKLTYAGKLKENIAIGVGIGLVKLKLSEIGTAWEKGNGESSGLTVDAGISIKNILPILTLVNDSAAEENPLSAKGDIRDDKGLSLGIALCNIGPKLTFIDAAQADPISATLKAGLLYNAFRNSFAGLVFGCDLENRIYEGSLIDYIHWGSEVRLYRIIFIRGGYFQDISGPKNSYWTWGAGIYMFGASLNIAHYKQTLLPSWHFDATISKEIR